MLIKRRFIPNLLISLFSVVAFGSASTAWATNSITTIGNKTRIVAGNRTLEVEQGIVYEVGESRTPIEQLYDPNFVQNTYTKNANIIYRIIPNHGNLQVKRNFTENFDSANTVRDLIGADVNWTAMTVQGEGSPTVASYVDLRHKILRGQSDFLDNRIDPSTQRKHSGTKSLRTFTKATTNGLDVNKSSLDTELTFFARGDDFWFSGWFFLEQGKPASLIDLESAYMKEGPGIRLMLDDELRPSVQLKFAYKPAFKMPQQTNYSLPTGKWVHLRLHIYLMDSDAGRVRLWMDNTKLIDQAGRTLTMFDAVYNSLQVGITAAPPNMNTVLYMDDIRVSDSGL
ncbi:heparin lyase I family protein [Aliiglaciecola litoralis]|uniref:Polysaccharide lyase n=1 Tax=Aliiglaciecola litoralis TaxID=582857 RepID=A0ABN1LIL3_9ALTE